VDARAGFRLPAFGFRIPACGIGAGVLIFFGADPLVVGEVSQPGAPLFGHDAGGVVGESGKYGNFMTCLRPVVGEFGGTRGGRTHLWREIL
jgi:hypothetical protein